MSISPSPRAWALLAALLAASAWAQDAVPPESPAPYTPPSLEADLSQRAAAQFAAGEIAAAISTHQVLETALTGSARSRNRDALWRSLNALPVDTDFSAVTEPIARGWIELMQLARSGAPLATYEDWRQRHADHPGESQIAAGLVTQAVRPAQGGRQIALLLPMSGPLAAAAKAIQAGAEAAQRRAGAEAPPLAVQDSSASLDTALAAALSQGAAALIGPLRKEDVAALAARIPDRPTITLNYLDAGRSAPAGFTPFGLAPEDEARAAADHAASASRLRAVVLSQEGDWGSRTAAAFKAQFESRGGVVLAEASFRPNAVDFTALLKRSLGISYAEARGKALEAAGVKAELQPVPRGDIDVVFLAARSAQAKLIWPQMRYLRAGRIATYAPAAAADAGNRDLGRLMVCDAPWRIETQGTMAALRGELATVNPRSADAQRLFALGYDAYELARRALASALGTGESLPGLTGNLVLEADGAVRRRLDCVALYAPRIDGLPDDPAE